MKNKLRTLTKRSWFELSTVLGIGFLTCFGLFAYSVVLNRNLAYSYLLLNLGLAAIPLLLSWRLIIVLKKHRWSDWEPLFLTLVWVIFIPNSFYMISDYIHLQDVSATFVLYYAVMFTSFIWMGVCMGFASLYQVHKELKKRVSPRVAAVLIAVLILGCCVAIYLGRDLRWNSWDIVINPGGVLFDISNLLLRPRAYPDMGRTISSFFVLIGSSYLIVWQVSRMLWRKGVSDLALRLKQHHRPLR